MKKLIKLFVLFSLLIFMCGCSCKTEVSCNCPMLNEKNNSDGSIISWQPCECNDANPDQRVLGRCVFELE